MVYPLIVNIAVFNDWECSYLPLTQWLCTNKKLLYSFMQSIRYTMAQR